MQNLTVIPGHWDEDKTHHDEGYTLIIGHRRFAAGKMAGVAMYPCRIVEDIRNYFSTKYRTPYAVRISGDPESHP